MLITGGHVFLDGQFIDTDIRIENDLVTAVGCLDMLPGEDVYAADGQYVLPGFVDIHIHGCMGADCMRGAQDVRTMSRALAATGTAAFVPTTMSATIQETNRALQGIRQVMDAPETEGAAVLGAHMEAPFLNPARKGAQRGDCLLVPDMEAYRAMTGQTDCVRMMTIAPELPGAVDLIQQLTAEGVTVCGGHTSASAEEIHRAADAGLTQITHLFNAQTPLHHREPGVPGAGLADDRLAVQIIADGIHLHPDILRITGLCKGSRGTVLITDAMEAAGLPDGVYDLGGQTVWVREGAARLADGTLAGSTLTMDRAVRNMINMAGIAPETVIPMATSTPADSIGTAHFGRIQPGKAGFLNLMTPDWQLTAVVRNGALYPSNHGMETRS